MQQVIEGMVTEGYPHHIARTMVHAYADTNSHR